MSERMNMLIWKFGEEILSRLDDYTAQESVYMMRGKGHL